MWFNKKWNLAVRIIFTILGAFLCYAMFYGKIPSTAIQSVTTQSRESVIAQAQDISYTDLAHNPDTYKNQTIQLTGKVIQVSNDDTYRLAVDDDYSEIALISFNGNFDDQGGRIVENDEVTFYGTYNGITTYTAVLGNSVSIPKMTSAYFDR